MCIRDRYNVQQFTSYRTKHNNWDPINAKIDGQRVVYGQDNAYAKYKPHLKVMANAEKIKYKGRLLRNPDNLKPFPLRMTVTNTFFKH